MAGRITRSPDIDEIPLALGEFEALPLFGNNEWLNDAHRDLKNDRDGRLLETRLDAAESMPWLLDVIFTLAGRVRPYHKYLPWELRQHPLADWPAEALLDLLQATLDGDPRAVRATFARVELLCHDDDQRRGHSVLTDIINDWGDELDLLR